MQLIFIKRCPPLYSKAYSFKMGALSSNNEIKKGVREVKQHIGDKGCWVFDRGADTGILKDFFIGECSQAIIRLKRNTMIFYKKIFRLKFAKKTSTYHPIFHFGCLYNTRPTLSCTNGS